MPRLIAFCFAAGVALWWFYSSGWKWKVGLALPALLSLILLLELADGAVGQLVYRQPVNPAKIRVYTAFNNAGRHRTLVFLPGTQNSGDLTIAQYIDRRNPTPLQRFANVVVVDYPSNGFNGPALFQQLLEFMRLHGLKNPEIMGMSVGTTIGIDFVRWYQRQHSPVGEITQALWLCGPADKGDIVSPLFKMTPLIKAGPLVRSTYAGLQWLFFLGGPKQPTAEGADPRLTAANQRFIRHFDARGGLEQIRFIYNAKPVRPNEFPNIRALIVRTIGPDVLVKHTAVPKLQAAFPDNKVQELPGIHANLIEEFPAYDRAIVNFLQSTPSIVN